MKKQLLFMSFLWMTMASAAIAQIQGQVKTKDNEPLPGVSILVKGTTNGTTTDSDGNFSINTSDSNATLLISFIGYATREVQLGGRTTLDVMLEEDNAQLDEVVVTAFGIPRETKSIGYATATVQGENLTRTASPNFASALYGKAPGVRIATTPGGATSAVNITVRGINSVLLKNQPLIVLNGMPIRDGEVNNSAYWTDQRLRGNGLLDINPEDIENISILKGASAAALYGSDAVNGVVLITTKTGKGTKGFKVDFSTSYTVDKIAYLPRYQNVRGQGYPLNFADGGQSEDGFLYRDMNGDGVKETRGHLGTSLNFGPKFDGQPTLSWDGTIRPYEAQKNGYDGLFQTAHNKIHSVAVSYGGENYSTRLSFTRQDNEGLSIGSKNEKNVVNLNSNFKLGKNYSVDVIVNYINQYTKNRPYSVDRLTNNFTGMIARFDNADWYLDRYKTSKGYRFVTGTNPSLTPHENIIYPGFRNDLMDYVWRVKEHNSEEFSNRIISSITNTWNITKGLTLRGRFGADITGMRVDSRNSTEMPLTLGNSGSYSLENTLNNLLYGDALLSYTKDISSDIKLTVAGGYMATRQTDVMVSRSTNNGLSTENFFDVSASVDMANSDTKRTNLVKDAVIGMVNASYKDYLFLELTGRKDRTSTMHPSNNTFFYPSVNSSFVFSDAFAMPRFLSSGKLRASWGIVGNYPDIYGANIAYDQNTLGTQVAGGKSVLYTNIPVAFGNDGIKVERKYEYELGLQTRFADNRFGLDVTYYDGQIRDQILNLTLPSTAGATSVLTNIGTLRNKGLEVAFTASAIRRTDFNWDIIFNVAKNKNVVEKLANGATELLHADYDGNAAQLKSVVGQPMGDFYAHPVATDANGNMIVDPNGLYKVDPEKMVKVGNAMPKAVGGLINTLSYKAFTLTAVLDFRYGGYVMPTALNWMISRGLLEESLNNMDTEHGGLSYYELSNPDGTVKRIQVDPGQARGPGGERIYHDGMLQPGVTLDGSPNDYIASATEYYAAVYGWGGPQYSPNTRYELFIKENNYVKMRELSLSYRLPSALARKIRARNIDFSVFGRNLFFVYRSLKDMDPEQTTAGSRWTQTLTNVGTNPSSRSMGASLRVSF